MNKLIFLAAIIPVLLVPNVYASGAREDWSDKYDDMPGAPECWVYGYDDGQNNPFSQDRQVKSVYLT